MLTFADVSDVVSSWMTVVNLRGEAASWVSGIALREE
jgi:hypothetical protein